MVGMAGFLGWRVGLSLLWLSFPHCGNALLKPLDSGLRRNDAGAVVENLSRVKHGANGLTKSHPCPPSSFQRRLESRGGW